MSITPWSAPSALRNQEKCDETNQAGCALCGKAVKEPWPYQARVVAGGGRFATRREYENLDPVSVAGDLGYFPVGSSCAKKLLKAGVYVHKLVRGDTDARVLVRGKR